MLGRDLSACLGVSERRRGRERDLLLGELVVNVRVGEAVAPQPERTRYQRTTTRTPPPAVMSMSKVFLFTAFLLLLSESQEGVCQPACVLVTFVSAGPKVLRTWDFGHIVAASYRDATQMCHRPCQRRMCHSALPTANVSFGPANGECVIRPCQRRMCHSALLWTGDAVQDLVMLTRGNHIQPGIK